MKNKECITIHLPYRIRKVIEQKLPKVSRQRNSQSLLKGNSTLPRAQFTLLDKIDNSPAKRRFEATLNATKLKGNVSLTENEYGPKVDPSKNRKSSQPHDSHLFQNKRNSYWSIAKGLTQTLSVSPAVKHQANSQKLFLAADSNKLQKGKKKRKVRLAIRIQQPYCDNSYYYNCTK